MTIYTRRAIIVVLASRRLDANNVAKVIDIQGGERTFWAAALSGNGQPPPTHYWCSWSCTEAEWVQITDLFDQMRQQGRVWLYDGLITTLEEVLAIHSLVPCPSPLEAV